MEENSYEKIISKRSNGYAILTAIIFAVIVGVVFSSESYFAFQNTIEKNNNSLISITKLIEEKVAQSFGAIDLVLKANQKELTTETISIKNSNHLSTKLKYDLSRINNVYSIKIIDANGDLIADNVTPVKKVNYSDRDYFKILKNQNKDELVINPPIISRTTNNWVIVLGRSIYNIHNQFNGAIIATINLTDFMQNFSKYEISNKGIIALYDTNNVLYLRYPWIESVAGKKVDRPKVIKEFINSKRSISYDELLSPVDGIVRLSFSKKILDDRFIITVGESKNVVLNYWYKKFMLFSFLLFGSGVLFYTFFMKFLNSTVELERKRKETIQAAKLASIGEMTAGIAHEINNPIMIIFGSLKSIKKYLLTDIVKVEQNILKIEKQINRIDRIIKGLKAFSRDTSYENFQPTEVDKIINDSIELIQSEIFANDIKIQIIDDLRNKTIECNEIQIEQVIINIIKNSIDAISGKVERWINIHLYNRNGAVIIRIVDSGNGIPESIRNKIMNPFFTTKEVGKGTGLGLSISQGIIASHGGKIYLDESERNTCFVIELNEGMNFDYVIKTHLEFKDNLKNYILNPNNSIDKNIIGSDKHCEFGKWIIKHEKDYYHLEEWNKTIILHRKFHEISAEIVQLVDNKSTEKLNTKMHELDLVSDEIVLLIFKLKDHF